MATITAYASRTAMATGSDGDVAYLSEGGREGAFRWVSGTSVPTDTFQGIYVSKPGGAWVRIVDTDVNLAWFGAVNNGDITQRLFEAVQLAGGRMVRIPPNATYTVANADVGNANPAIRWIDQDVRIDARGAIITCYCRVQAIEAAASWVTVPVESVGLSDVTLPVGTATTGFVVGAKAKLISAEQQFGARSGAGRGEVVYVRSVLGQKISFTAPLKTTYTPSTADPSKVRLCLYSGRKFELIGGQWDAATGHANSSDSGPAWKTQIWTVSGYDSPRFVDPVTAFNYAQTYSVVGCVNASFRGSRISGILNNGTNMQIGYGINVQSSEGTSIVDARFGRTRHCVSSTQVAVTSADSPELFGPVRFMDAAVQTNGIAQGSLDTHEGSEDCILRLGMSDSPVLDSGVGAGICLSVRGLRHRADSPKGRNGRIGVQVWTDNGQITDPAQYTDGIVIENADMREMMQVALQTNYVRTVTIRGGTFSSQQFETARLFASERIIFEGVVTVICGTSVTATTKQAAYLLRTNVENRGTVIFDLSQVNGFTDGLVINLDKGGGGTASPTSIWVGGTIKIIPPTAGVLSNIADGRSDAIFKPDVLLYGTAVVSTSGSLPVRVP